MEVKRHTNKVSIHSLFLKFAERSHKVVIIFALTKCAHFLLLRILRNLLHDLAEDVSVFNELIVFVRFVLNDILCHLLLQFQDSFILIRGFVLSIIEKLSVKDEN